MGVNISMNSINYLINKYQKRVPYENRGKEHDKLRKRENRLNELYELCEDLFNECERYKRLRLTPYQKERVKYIVKKFGNNSKKQKE